MPKMTVALESGAVMGASSKGFGGGAGGGIGTGYGPGRGGGRNMVSFFGGTGFDMPGLIGAFYDFKQTARGADRGLNTGRYISEVRQFFRRNWDVAYLDSNFFKAPKRLVLPELYIPDMAADGAPKAFDVPVRPSNWIVHYKGRVEAPFSGKFRFVGLADDLIAVRWAGKNVLENSGGDSGQLFERSKQGNRYGSGKPPPGVEDSYPGFRPGWPMRVSPWLAVSKGSKYAIEVVIGEAPGSAFCAFLCIELEKERGKVTLFRMDKANLIPRKGPEPPGIDWSGGGHIWKPEMSRGSQRQR
jgi:hypothetical protein